jgi:3-oxoacyl-[acyl-carrier protein] reductase
VFTPVKGRSVIVTGGSKGIGKGIAGVFVREGANVLIAARDEGMLSAAAEELAAGAEGKVETTVASRTSLWPR